jgi:hypothetical protein
MPKTPASVEKPKRPRWLLIAGAVAVLVVLAVILAVLLSSPGDDVAPAEDARPTETSSPTSTPPPTGEASAAFVEYADAVLYELLNMSDGVTRVIELVQNPAPDDQGWITEAASAIVTIRQAYGELEGMDVDPEFQDLHDVVLDSTVDCYTATDYLVSGIDNDDAADIEQAVTLVESCNSKMDEATGTLNSGQP